MRPIPRDPGFDHTLALKADPYRYIAERCRHHGSDVFETRLLLQRTLCMSGPAAARLFYDEDRFVRHGAAPEPLRATLFGKRAVQGLDGEAHAHRKAQLLSVLAPARVDALAAAVEAHWMQAARKCANRRRVHLYAEAQRVHMRAVCEWAGVPLPEGDVAARTAEVAALYDAAARTLAGHVRSRMARRRAERWLTAEIERVRASGCSQSVHALHAVASFTATDGAPLPADVATVELLNILRPTVAVAVFVTFVAHALHLHPECMDRLRTGDEAYLEAFVQEVRRDYPFFPAVIAVTRRAFDWEGYRFPAGVRVLLDLYGTDHDARVWHAPHQFSPERWLSGRDAGPRERLRRDPDAYEFIPQGGGDAGAGHRCPGEGVAIALMKVAARFLATRLDYDVPPQDLRLDMERLPALPRSGFLIAGAAALA